MDGRRDESGGIVPRRGLVVILAVMAAAFSAAPAAQATAQYVPISGGGSADSGNLLDTWARHLDRLGIRINYAGIGSSDGRREFSQETVDFAVTEIPYGVDDAVGGSDLLPARPFSYIPVAGTATAFAYNLSIGSERVTNLRLSPATLAGIFTGSITRWDDAAIARDNPYLALPGRTIVPVLRSDGAGSSYQLTRWLASEAPHAWDAYCTRAGIAFTGSCGPTSFIPRGATSVVQSGTFGVAGYVRATSDTITYVDYATVLQTGLPAVKLRNAAGYFVEPTAPAVSIALRDVEVNTDASDPATYLTQESEGAYRSADPRAYSLSAYTYAVIPTSESGRFSAAKGRTLGAFLSYAVCEGQQVTLQLGHAPLPLDLVTAGFDQIQRIPGVERAAFDPAACGNPTFDRDGVDTIARDAPQPPPCDLPGPVQCLTGTGGRADTPTPISRPAPPTATSSSTTGTSTTGTSSTGTTTTGTGTTTTSGTLSTTSGATTGVTATTASVPGTTPATVTSTLAGSTLTGSTPAGSTSTALVAAPGAGTITRTGALAVTGLTMGPLVALGLTLVFGGTAATRAGRRTAVPPPKDDRELPD